MVDHFHLIGSQLVHDRFRAVSRSIVDDYDFQIARYGGLHLLNDFPDRAPFIEARDDDGENHNASLEVAGLVPLRSLESAVRPLLWRVSGSKAGHASRRAGTCRAGSDQSWSEAAAHFHR